MNDTEKITPPPCSRKWTSRAAGKDYGPPTSHYAEKPGHKKRGEANRKKNR